MTVTVISGVDIHPRYQSDYRPRARDAFVFVKASEGSTVAYGQARLDHLSRCRAAGKVIGHYHWLHAGNVAAQVDHFADQPDIRREEILAVDWENKDPSVPASDVNAFLAGLRKRFPRNRIVVYSYACYIRFVAGWNEIRWDLADGLWIADYRARSNQLGQPHQCSGQPMPMPWLIWQYTTNGESLDENRAQFDSQAAMRAWARGLESPDSDDWLADPRDVWEVEIPLG